MILAIARFEIGRRLRGLSTYVYFALFLLLSYLLMIAAGGAFASVDIGMGAGGKVLVNSPYTLQEFISLLSFFGLLITGAICGQAVYQDFHSRSHPFFFTSPIRERDYLLGRFLGAIVVLIFIFSSIGVGCWLGSKMWFLEKAAVGPNHLAAYVQPYLVSVIPNLLFAGALFFGLAALTQSITPVYVTSVLLLIGYLIAGALTRNVENKTVAALLDPFGQHAAARLTEYWTIAEKNTRVAPLRGIFLANRLLWTGVGLSVLALTLSRFRFAQPTERVRKKAVPSKEAPAAVAVFTGANRSPGALRQLARLTRLSLVETVKNVYFPVIVFAGVLFMLLAASTIGSLYGTNTYPVTYQVLDGVGGSFGLFMLILITVYSGELVWRERDAHLDQLCDSLPTPTWLPFVAKLSALILIQALLLAVVMVTGILIQTFKGYFHYELALYFKELFGLRLIDYALLCVLAMLIQVLVNQKYIGHFVMVVYYLVSAFMPEFGLEHRLYRYASSPDYTYSDMNGFGNFLRPVFWFDLYWAIFAVLLAMVTNLFWVRGLETSFSRRCALARARLHRPLAVAMGALTLAFIAVGGFIYYNTNILNKYRIEYQINRSLADYERLYKRLEHVAQPRITSIDWNADLFPDQQTLIAHGVYQLLNKTATPIPVVYVGFDPELEIRRLTVGGSTASQRDVKIGFFAFSLPQPLAPGAGTTLEFEFVDRPHGFKNGGASTSVVGNGTFYSSGELPQIGYSAQHELTDDDARKKQGLAPKERMADVNDVVARQNTYVASDADWLLLTTTVSTAPDQLAVAPGTLEKEWSENGRRYFRYRTPHSVLNLHAVLSARYQAQHGKWKDVDIEIDYHPGHEYNVSRMIGAVQKSLDYYTENYGPYQHKVVRIVEFPRYQSFAQSLPNTIPYSESIGFIARVDPADDKDLDYPFYVTAHEVAHQWWAHQVIGGNVQGATMLSETMAQYSALMVMKKEYGPDKMKRFLHYELDRYLSGRSLERKKELPLFRVENQPYVHYQKGGLVMYALADYIGEDKVNQALAAFLRKVAYQEPPYTNSLELVGYLKNVTPPDLQYLIEDLFETITLYDNRAIEARWRPRGKQFDVELTVTARKLRAGELGEEKQLPLNDLIDVGVLGDDGKLLALEKRRITAERTTLTLTVDAKPAKAGIDPLNKLIDRVPDDNLVKVDRAD